MSSFFPVHPIEPVERALEAFRAQLHTAMPAVAVSYDRATQTGQFRPAVRRPLQSSTDDEVDVYEAMPDVHAPVVWPRGNGGIDHLGLVPGDGVLLVFAQADFEAYRATGQAGDPADNRTFSMSHGWAIPGAFARAQAVSGLSSDPEWGRVAGPRLRAGSSAIGVGVDPADTLAKAVALADRVNQFVQALKAAPAPVGPAVTAALAAMATSPTAGPGLFGSDALKVSG